MLSIIYSKILQALESSTLSNIFSGFLLLLVACIFTLVSTYTNDALHAMAVILSWENAIILKAVVSVLVVFNASTIFTFVVRTLEGMAPESESVRTIDSIDGIPRVELMDHLFTVGSFKRDDVEQKWKIPRYRVAEISKKLEDLGVLVRGENNARVLNTEFTREDIGVLLDGKSSVGEIGIFTRKTESGFSHKPSGQELMDRVSPFITRRI